MLWGAVLCVVGVLVDLLGVPASQAALGRSHICILSQHGSLYTFGNNQYGQCGRSYVPPKDAYEGGCGLVGVARTADYITFFILFQKMWIIRKRARAVVVSRWTCARPMSTSGVTMSA